MISSLRSDSNILKNFFMNHQAKYSISKPYQADKYLNIFVIDIINLDTGKNPKSCNNYSTASVGGDSYKIFKIFSICISG